MEFNELMKKPYLTEKEVAAITGRAWSTLRNERFMRRGLPYYKVGGVHSLQNRRCYCIHGIPTDRFR
jgi:hypothetical protein